MFRFSVLILLVYHALTRLTPRVPSWNSIAGAALVYKHKLLTTDLLIEHVQSPDRHISVVDAYIHTFSVPI